MERKIVRDEVVKEKVRKSKIKREELRWRLVCIVRERNRPSEKWVDGA